VRYVRRQPRRRNRLLQSAIAGPLDLRPAMRGARVPVGEVQLMRGSRLFSGLLLVGLGMLLCYVFASQEFYVYGIEVEGGQHLGVEEVFEASGVNEMSVFYIRPQEVEAQLERLLWVSEAHAWCGFPNRVRITLRERQVAFLWQSGATAWAVDGEGTLLPLGQAPEDVLLVEDRRYPPGEQTKSGGAGLDREVIASVLAVREALPEVTHMIYDPAYGLIFQSARGYDVRLGEGQVTHKVALWRTLEAELVARGIQPSHVDVRFPRGPCYGTEEALAGGRACWA
jgi:cell division septal protein FtsQ